MPNTEIKGNCRKDMSDLALSQTYVPDVPKDIIFPDELNAYLRDQLQVSKILLLCYLSNSFSAVPKSILTICNNTPTKQI